MFSNTTYYANQILLSLKLCRVWIYSFSKWYMVSDWCWITQFSIDSEFYFSFNGFNIIHFRICYWNLSKLDNCFFETLGVGNLCEALTAFICLFLITRGLRCYEENAGVFVFVIPPVWLSTCSVMLSTCSGLKMEREEGGMVSCS